MDTKRKTANPFEIPKSLFNMSTKDHDDDHFLQLPSLGMELDNFLNLNLHQPSSADNIMDLHAEAEQQRLRVLEG